MCAFRRNRFGFIHMTIFKTQVFHYWRKRTGFRERRKWRFRSHHAAVADRLNNPSTLRRRATPTPSPVYYLLSPLKKSIFFLGLNKKKKNLYEHRIWYTCPSLARSSPTIRRPSCHRHVMRAEPFPDPSSRNKSTFPPRFLSHAPLRLPQRHCGLYYLREINLSATF